jgi:hypothetical protein
MTLKRDELAGIIANHLDRDAAEMYPPTEDDYFLADTILDRIHGPHGYRTIFRRVTGIFAVALIAVAIAIGIVLSHARSAQ